MEEKGDDMRLATVCLFGGILATLSAVHGVAARGADVQGEWAGITAEQLAEHLGLTGGNITFKFEQPVFLRVREVVKAGKDTPANTHEDWSDKPSTQYVLTVIVDKKDDGSSVRSIDEVHRAVQVHWTRHDSRPVETNEVAITGRWTEEWGVGWECKISFQSKQGRTAERGTWKGSNAIRLGEEQTVYEFYDPDAKDESFYRLSIYFTPTRPPKEDKGTDGKGKPQETGKVHE